MASIDDYRKDDGDIDWKSLKEAEIQDGTLCSKCHAYIFPGKSKGHIDQCYSCKSLLLSEAADHETLIRCPFCCHEQTVHGSENYDLLSEGEHEACCENENCEKEYTINTSISWSFQSPPLEGV